jgi:hypothetical protein
MPVADREAFRVTPRWYTELSVGVGLIAFAAVTAYPWRGAMSELAGAVAICLSVAGAFVLIHSVRLGKRANWRWLKMDTTEEKVLFPKERATAAAIVLLMLAAVYASLDFSTPSLALRPEWWAFIGGSAVFSFLLYVGWRSRN